MLTTFQLNEINIYFQIVVCIVNLKSYIMLHQLIHN